MRVNVEQQRYEERMLAQVALKRIKDQLVQVCIIRFGKT